LGPELEKVAQRWRTTGIFNDEQPVEVNEQICERRPVELVAEESELEQLKKKITKGNTAGSGTRDKPATGESAAAGEARFGSAGRCHSGLDAPRWGVAY